MTVPDERGRGSMREHGVADAGAARAMAVLVVVLVACVAVWGYGLLADRGLGVPNPPFAMRDGASAGIGVLLAVAVLAVGVLGAERLLGVRRAAGFLAGATGLALAARLAVNASRADGTAGWTETFALDAAEGPMEYLAGRPALQHGPGFLLDRFAELVPSLPVHVAGHPPGMLLLMDALRIETASALAALCIAAGVLVVPLAYALGRGLRLAERPARVAALLAALAPGPVLMGATSADALFATVALACAALLVRPRAWPLGAALLAVASLLQWALLAVGAFAAILLALTDRRRALLVAAGCGAAVLALHGLLAVLAGWDPLGTIRATENVYRLGIASGRPYAYWLFGSPVAAFVFGGAALLAAWSVAAARGQHAAVALAVVVLAAAVLGFSKAETERIWLFLVVLACVPAATAIPDRLLRPALGALAVQALGVQLLFDTVW